MKKRSLIISFVIILINCFLPSITSSQNAIKYGISTFGNSLRDTIGINTIDGGVYIVGQESNEIFVLNFWFIACGPCRKEIPELNSLAKKYSKEKNIHFISISNIDSEDAIRYVMKKMSLQFEQVAKGQVIADHFLVNRYPTNIIIGQDGTLLFKKIGYNYAAISKIDSILAHQIVNVR